MAEQRHEAFAAEAYRHRLIRLAESSAGAPQHRWSGQMPVVAVVAALTLLAAGTVTVPEPAASPLTALAEAADSVARHLLAADEAETSAVQKVREAARVEAAATVPTADAEPGNVTPGLML